MLSTTKSSALAELSLPQPDLVSDRTRSHALFVAIASLVILLVWAWLFPYTGEGDSVMHLLNARDALANPKDLLYPWARPLFKVLITPVSGLGVFPARAIICVVSAFVVYHTIRLAQDLKLPRPLLAGVLLMLHPFVFANASDTMSELPMALGLVLAVRLWINDRKNWSCLLIGFTPMLRPEGFFMAALWGVLCIADVELGMARFTLRQFAVRNSQFAIRSLLLATGVITWSLLCGLFSKGEFLLWVHAWSWPMQSYSYYKTGSLLYHVWMWPAYMGLALIVPFCVGCVRLWWTPRLWLPATVFAVVFVVHSILFWGHWFASAGLLRIFACVGPFTAIITLLGWNLIADALAKRASPIAYRAVASFACAFAVGCVLFTYWVDVAHWYTFPRATARTSSAPST
ncbi:MAG: hypothetical protein QM770_21110 [Tepidisphaeraceae bacterium]